MLFVCASAVIILLTIIPIDINRVPEANQKKRNISDAYVNSLRSPLKRYPPFLHIFFSVSLKNKKKKCGTLTSPPLSFFC